MGRVAPTKTWAGPRWVLGIHLILTIGILMGENHDDPNVGVTGGPDPFVDPNYMSFESGGESIAVAVGGLRWYG